MFQVLKVELGQRPSFTGMEDGGVHAQKLCAWPHDHRTCKKGNGLLELAVAP